MEAKASAKNKDLYKVLELKPSCSQDEVRAQYKKLALVRL